jgi:transposase
MRKRGFLSAEDLQTLVELSRDGLAQHRLARRANALVLLDRGMSYREVATVLLIDDDTVRQWRAIFETEGVEGLAGFHFSGRQAFLSEAQEVELAAWVEAEAPRSTRAIGGFIEQRFGVSFASRSGLIALLHRLGFVHRKPEALSSKMDPQQQRRFIAGYESLLNHLPGDEMVMFADAVHPVHSARPVGCWVRPDAAVAVEQKTGRDHLNIHGALDLESGQTQMLLVDSVNAESTIALLAAIERQFPRMRRIHVFVDQARCHRAKLVRAWLSRPNCRIRLHFVPAYCPHLNPIERLWGAMHKALTHNRCSASLRVFQTEVLTFLRHTVPRQWDTLCDAVSDNFRIRQPALFRMLK